MANGGMLCIFTICIDQQHNTVDDKREWENHIDVGKAIVIEPNQHAEAR
jgi:hypothetical protein